MSQRRVRAEFLDLVNYAVCSAVSKCFGSTEAEKLFGLAGKIGYNELRTKRDVETTDPIDLLKRIAQFLEEMGYMERIEVKRRNDNQVVVDMYGVSVWESSDRLTKEGAAPSHYMTNLMFAALETLDLRADIQALEFKEEALGHVRELWTLKKR